MSFACFAPFVPQLLPKLVPGRRRNEQAECTIAPATKPSLDPWISAIGSQLGHFFQCARFRGRRISGFSAVALVGLSVSPRSLRAADESVSVECPGLESELVAELEARGRASLLTSPLAATARIICEADGAKVIVTTPESRAEVETGGAEPLREAVLRALDDALGELGRTLAPTNVEPAGSAVPATPQSDSPRVVAPVPAASAEARRPAVLPAAPPAPSSSRARRFWSGSELGVRAMVELWKDRLAIGGGAGAAINVAPAAWVGLRAGGYRPLGVSEFGALEVHAQVEGSWDMRSLAGLRSSLAIGPSVLRIAPPPDFSAAPSTVRTAIRVEAQLSRPFRFDWIQLSPWLGVRFFSGERGVRVSTERRLVLGSVLPQIGIVLSYRD